jgi:lipoprotein-anchoring transpeptidase ErfK/SrfK
MVAEVYRKNFCRRNGTSRVTSSKLLIKEHPMPRFLLLALLLFPAAGLRAAETPSRVIVSIHDQKLMLLENGAKVATYPISTSKFGIGDRWGSMATPLGFLQVAQKIGDHAPVGAVFHRRRFTGEVLQANAPGRDPVITRIIWLRGLEPWNSHAFARCIYIHGTPEEKTIGRPASYGCIRMKSRDVTALYDQIQLGAVVQIVPDALPKVPKAKPGSPNELITTSVKPTDKMPVVPSSKDAANGKSLKSGVKA